MNMRTIVRCADNMVFDIHPVTLEAATCSRYDPYCYCDPVSNVKYIEYHEWIHLRDRQWDAEVKAFYKQSAVRK
jgi:hypothetical protein